MPPTHPNVHPRSVLITGASSGIGAALMLKLGGMGLHMIGAARRAGCLENIKETIIRNGGKADFILVDLAKPEQRFGLENQIRAIVNVPDIIINNAGFGWYGYHSHLTWPVAQEMLAVNVQAAAHLSLMFLKEMVERGSGHLIQMGSIAGDLPSQGIALYAGTKAFLSAFTTGLQRELRGSGVHASVIKPGPVKTPFFERSKNLQNGRAVPSQRFAIPAESVARVVWSVIQRPRRVAYVPGIMAVSPWVELTFAWIMDRIGPLLLKKKGL